MKRLWKLLLLSTVAILPGALTAEEPYGYTDVLFNKGANYAAGPFFVGDGAVDVINALWDNTGFMYPRAAFRRFNGTQRSLAGNGYPVKGLYRFVKTPFPPDEAGLGRFLAACSLYVFSDSSITDTSQAFKKEGIGFHGTYLEDATGGADAGGDSVWFYNPVNNFAQDFYRRIIPMEPFFQTIDSAQYLRATPTVGSAFFLPLVTYIDISQLLTQGTATPDTFFNYRIRACLDPGAQAQFVQMGNRVIFGDSTKPLRFYSGVDTGVTVGFIADEIIDQTVTTTMGSGLKAYFDDQWAGYWVRFLEPGLFDTRNGVIRYQSPFAPITSNTDTLLYLRFDPLTDGQGLICSFPIELVSKPYTIVQKDGAGLWIRLTGLPSDWSLWNSTNTVEARNCSYPLEIIVDDTLYGGQTRMVTYIFGDTLWFTQEPTPAAIQGQVRLVVHRPVIPRTMEVHQDRLWVVDVAYPNRIYYSEPLAPEEIGPLNFIEVFPRDGDKINDLVSYKDQLLAKKGNSIARIVGDNPSNFVTLPFLENLGTAGLNSNAQFGGDDYFLDPKTGVYVLREFNPVRLSDEVKPLLDSIPSASANKVAFAIHDQTLWVAYPAGAGQTKNNRLLSYHIPTKNWSRHTFNEAAVLATWPLAGDSTRLVAGDQDSGTVYVYTESAKQEHIPADTGRTVKLTYKTGWMALSSPEQRKRLRGLQLAYSATADADRDTCFIYKDFATTAFDTAVFARTASQEDNYDTKDVNGLGYGRFFQFKWEVAPSGNFKFHSGRKKWVNIGF